MSYPDEQPLVSVCIQTYQHAAYIKECLDSALRQQTNFPFEIILGEDDSTDGTREICKEYAEQHPDIIHLFLRSEKDKIFISGHKTGRFNFIENLKAARGKYIAWLDGDDYWTDNLKLQKQVDFLEANPDCSLCYHKVFFQRNKGKVYSKPESHWPGTGSKFTVDDLIYKGGFINSVSCMFRQQNIQNLPPWFWEIPFIDYSFYIHCAGQGKIGFIPETMAVYRIHRGGMWAGQKAPVNSIKAWYLLSTLAVKLEGDFAETMIEKRHTTGMELVSFYKDHRWYNRKWFEKELQQKKFEQDEELLRSLRSSLSAKNYLMNGLNLCKAIGRVILKRN